MSGGPGLIDAEVVELLADPKLRKLWAAARRRLEGNGLTLYGAPLTLRGLDRHEADAVGGLLGIPRPRATVRVRLDALDRVLRTSAAGKDLMAVLAEVGGPLRDRRAERAASVEAKAATWESLAAHPAVARHPTLGEWLAEARSSGLARRLSGLGGEAAAVSTALDVLTRLPADGVHLAVLAAELTGDAHGLDRRRPVGTLVVHALAHRAGCPYPHDAAGWRQVWSTAGVVCDDLSSHVLVLNLRPGGDDIVATTLDDHACFGEPVRLTLRQISTGELEPDRPVPVFVCENPAVAAAAADQLGRAAPTMVCVEGMPSTAALVLLDRLAGAGCSLRYHGDFDWRGLAIGAATARRLPIEPWRYRAADYREAVAAGLGSLSLAGPAASAPWDADLEPAMAAAGVAVHEEQVVPRLLEDLAVASS